MKEISLYKFCPICREELEITQFEEHDLLICPKCKFEFFLNPRPCVSAIIIKDDKILLQKRAYDPGKGTWEIPGGFMQPEETCEEALKREVKEELNLELIDLKYFTSKCGTYPYKQLTYNTVINYFICNIEGDLENNHEVEESDYFEIGNLPEIGFDKHAEVLTEFKNSLKITV